MLPHDYEFVPCRTRSGKPGPRGRGMVLLVLLLIVVFIVSWLLFLVSPGLAVEDGSTGLKSAIAGQMFQVFFLLIVLGGSVGAVAYRLIKSDVNESVERRVAYQIYDERKRARSELEAQKIEILKFVRDERKNEWQQTKYARRLAEAAAFQGIATGFLENYDAAFQQYTADPRQPADESSAIEGRADRRSIAREAEGAAVLADKGRLTVEEFLPTDQLMDESLSYYKQERERLHIWLLNHLIYHQSVVRVLAVDPCDREESTPMKTFWKQVRDQEHTAKFSDACKYAFGLLERISAGTLSEIDETSSWQEHYDSIGFCLSISRHTSDQETGRMVLRQAANLEDPPPGHNRGDKAVAQRVLDEHDARFGLDPNSATNET